MRRGYSSRSKLPSSFNVSSTSAWKLRIAARSVTRFIWKQHYSFVDRRDRSENKKRKWHEHNGTRRQTVPSMDGACPRYCSSATSSQPMKTYSIRSQNQISQLDRFVTIAPDSNLPLNVTMLYEDDQTREWARE